ncbi:hypothetical protein M406DRAFT_106373 [Cryphonectria parasitica EP155]|uniref:Uncharacterized protein n=1 Tax=Cryphonectria parasitica (strain ATCC 38755 / EP155) TaxID=660469 RepID=A0A9P4Y5J7_CRYP1|nr:uncharacterized protein M406DRAFT_106373 [Cryphonectria parasitica EP155]KAF3766900.1 hypothetical protein M406DRAFT_106373 [Cryphonectria parasitica EP155]
MATVSSPPTLHLLLTPKADADGEIIVLHFSITIKSLRFKENDHLCTYGRHDEAHSSRLQHFLQGIPATLTDSDGSVPFLLSGEDEEKQVRLAREAIGDITFTADARALDSDHESSWDECVLRREKGGIVGEGWRFLPRFSIGACQVMLEWDLSGCPEGTRAVVSYGEGPEPIEVAGESDTILACVFMVGPVQSFPPKPEIRQEGTDSEKQGLGYTYWFGDLPQNLDAVKDYTAKILPRMSEHFGDEGASYRTFLRRAPKGLKGTALRASSIIDYDDDAGTAHDWDLIRMLNRTMVSTWARLDPEHDGTKNDWFTDGLSHLYTVFLPFRFGQRGPDYFRATVNAFLSAYFTNPLVSQPLSSVGMTTSRDDTSQAWYVTSAKALRACVYMLKMDAYTRRAAVARGVDVLRPMDDTVRDLLTARRRREKNGAKIQKEDWLDGLAHWIGREDAGRHFREMLEEGKLWEDVWPTACQAGALGVWI